MALLQQIWTLTLKNWLIVLGRHSFATVVRAFVLPIILTAFLSFARNLFVPSANFGISKPHAIRSLADGLAFAGNSGRNNVVFVNGGFKGGEIERVVDELVGVVRGAGKNATVLEDEKDLPYVCRASLRGITPCYGAVVFRGSPTEGEGGLWNYTIRTDGALGAGRINVDVDTNDAQVFMLPLQRAVDTAISRTFKSTDGQEPLSFPADEYPFTSLTTEERADRIRVIYQDVLMNWLGVTFVVAIIGVVYHMAGFIATERETGMSTLIESMMATKSRWQPQAARLLSYHLAFSLLYLPGIAISALILWSGVFAHTSAAVVFLYFILSGVAIGSMAIFGAAFFKKSQLSGVSITILYILLAIIAQTISWPKTGTVTALSLLFTPCNFTYFISYLARWEKQEWATDLTQPPPDAPWSLPGIVFFIFLAIQAIVYPILGALVERWLHGTTSSGRHIVTGDQNRGDLGPDCAVQLKEFTKIYQPGFLRRAFSFVSKSKDPVVAVNKLTLSASRGQILALLGANGSGKSTTLDTIAGINKASSGRITIDGTGGLGIAPQKNVLWDELTVEEHIRIFNRLKAPGNHASKDEIRGLVVAVDLEQKIKAQSRTLSGGQKRKLQLGMMLTGGSAVCCVDEVSSGLDPLSRRKIWDILLAERGRRTIILTTHFLDEADLLADYIAVMSKGNLRAKGTSVELKDRLGGGYRIHVNSPKLIPYLPDIEGVQKKATQQEAAYLASSSAMAAVVIKELEAAGITDYRFSGPTIEDVFLQLAEEVRAESSDGSSGGVLSSADDEKSGEKGGAAVVTGGVNEAEKGGLELLSGRPVGFLRQTWVLFLKRCVIFKGNWFPSAAAFVIPVIAAGLVMLFVRHQTLPGCSPADQSSRKTAFNIFDSDFEIFLVGGPSDKFTPSNLLRLYAPIYLNMQGSDPGDDGFGQGDGVRARADVDVIPVANFLENITVVDTLDEVNNAILQYRKNITPAAIWLGDDNSRPMLVYKGNGLEMVNAWFGQWAMDMLLTNTTIASTYTVFDTPFAPDSGNSLQLLVYIGLALCAYPAFFSLYPNLERRRNVRGLQYSNGVRPFPLWLAYTAFDFAIVLAGAVISIALLAGLAPKLWYHVGYIFLIFILYGLASILLAYNVSLFSANQLSAYAFTAAGQVVLLLLYLIAYMCVIMYAPVHRIDNLILVVHFCISVLAPITSVLRAMFVALNLFSTACDGNQLSSNPGSILQYGGPIVYLIVQILLLFLVLIWADGGNAGFSLRRMFSRSSPTIPLSPSDERAAISDEEVANELVRVKSSATATAAGGHSPNTDGLRVINLTKTFGTNTAVDNVTFGIPHGEVFALLGPNGAGKSTTISVIRGDLKPSHGPAGGDVFVEDASVTRHLAAARAHLGVCPQFDAVDQMTVEEHLRFYARVRGIPDVEHNVSAVIRAVGLSAFRDRQAHALSGGNKRKLSLGIALMGNPTVVLLDEPSSGLDAAAKRVMWRTLRETGKGRSILLTTHSMEEADALAGRAGILARRMLAMGSIDLLRRRFGDRLYVHLVCRGAPRTTDEEVERVRRWVKGMFCGAEVEEKTYHGQMRWSVAVEEVLGEKKRGDIIGFEDEEIVGSSSKGAQSSASAIGKLVVLLEENREVLGVEHYSVSPTTLDQVFLTVVGRHNVQEEGYENKEGKKKWWKFGKD